MKRFLLAAILLTAAANFAVAETNREAGQWIARGGVGAVLPDGDGLDTGLGKVEADDAYSITLTGVYMITDQFAVELLASYFWTHDIELDGAKIGETKQLPPTLSVQWYTPSFGAFQPYLGVGVNYTIFFQEKITDPGAATALGGDYLRLDDSVGIAFQVGLDYDINENWLVNFDLRWIDIETDATTSAGSIGTVEIDPYVVSLNVGYRF